MRIRILHSFFYPDKSAVSQILTDIAFHLAAGGDQVEVIASRGGYEGGTRLPRRADVNGVRIRRVWSPSLGKKSGLTRLADISSYTFGSFFRALFSPRADKLVVLTNPPMYALVGTLLRAFRREPYVYVVMDLYPDIAVAAGVVKPRGLATRVCRWLTKLTLRHACKVVVLGTCMAAKVARYGVSEDRIEIIRNWGDEGVVPLTAGQNPLRATLGLKDEFVVMYSGNMGVGHRFEDILQAALALRGRGDIRFLFVGGGVRRGAVQAFADTHKLANVTVLDYFHRDQLAHSLPLGDAHFVSLREGFEGLIVPSKTYGIMAAGRPVIYQGNPAGEIARMLTSEGGGKVIAEGDAAGLRDLIVHWADDRAAAAAIGAKAREVFERGYSRAISLGHYTQVLREEAR